ncbi:MAG TPA: hypothetical protein VE991_09130 [Acidimicrobiales bacterium]|nr:hypothetical protein [Acidimicrobiales bacterium]
MRPDGLTDDEGYVMDALVDAADAYADLPVEHPAEPGEFEQAIHRAQDLLAVRVARRDHPAGWARFQNGRLVDAEA